MYAVIEAILKSPQSPIIRAALILVSVSGQYQHILMVSESVKYIIQVPILLFMQYYP